MMHFNEITVHAEEHYKDLLREAEAERMFRSGRASIRYAVLGLLNYLAALAR
jgi:hypothetical protein